MRILTIVTTVGLLAASCGGSDDSSPSAAGSTDKTTIAPATTTTTTPAFDVDEYCELRVTAESESDVYFDSDELLDPTATEAFFVRQEELLTQAIGIAEPEILDALDAVLDRQGRIEVLVAANGYDMLASFEELQADTSLEIPTAIEDQLDAYDLDNCGIVADDDSTTSEEDDPSDEESRDGQIRPRVTYEDAVEAAASLTEPESLAGFVESMQEEFPEVTAEAATCIANGLSAEELLVLFELVDPGATDLVAGNPDEAVFANRVAGCGATMAQFGQ